MKKSVSPNLANEKIVACLDLGSSKLLCIIAAISSDQIKILGYGHKASKGILASAISDMKLAQRSIVSVVSEAERMAGFNISDLLVGISASQVTSVRKEVGIKIDAKLIRSADVLELANRIRGEFRAKNREIIHLVPLQYKIDNNYTVENPCYMTGEQLHAKFHVVSTSTTAIKNIENCLKSCHLSVTNYVVSPYASSLSCLNENENSLGTLLIDIGANITSFCLIYEEKLFYVGHCKIGGADITRDIATILGVDFETAEQMKALNGFLQLSSSSRQDPIDFDELSDFEEKITSQSSRGLITNIFTKGQVSDIIKSRVEEIIDSVRLTLECAGLPIYLIASVVLSGGGSSIVGIDRLASEILNKNVRIGYPSHPELFTNSNLNLNELKNCSGLGMLFFLRNLYLREKAKGVFDSKRGWFRKLATKLMS